MSAPSPAVPPAIKRALAFYRASDVVRVGSDPQLPADLRPVLRVAANESSALAEAARVTDEHPLVLREAAVLYLQRTLFDPAADSYRVLGVNRDAAHERIKEHYRLLLRWLHPDRNADAWEAQLAYRLTAAWQDLRTPLRRSEYDAANPGHESADGEYLRTAAGWMRVVPQADLRPANERFLSARAMRLLPPIVLAGLAVLALLTVWVTHLQQPRLPTQLTGNAPPAPTQAAEPARLRLAAEVAEIDLQPMPAASREPSSMARSAPAGTPSASAAATVDDRVPETAPPRLARDAPPGAAQTAAEATRTPAHKASSTARGTEERERSRNPAELASPEPLAVARNVAAPSGPTRVARPDPVEAPADEPMDGPTVASPRTSTPNVAATPATAATAPPQRAAVPVQGMATPTLENAQAAVSSAEPASLAPDDERDARLLLSRFILAYEAGDMAEMSKVFSRDARNERGDREQMLREYRRLFRSSSERRMQVRRVSWLFDADSLAVVASFHARISPRSGDNARELDGDIRFDLKREDGELRIYRLRHESASG